MSTESRRITRSFMFLYIGFYISQIIYYGYLPATLYSYGYGETFVGYVMTLMSASGLVLRLVIGYIIDKYSCPKALIITFFSIYAITQVIFFFMYQSVLFITLFSLISLGLVGIVATLCDSWVVKIREVRPSVDYGRARSFGSMSYAITGLITGQVIAAFSNSALAYFALVAWLVLISAASSLPNPPKIDKTKGKVTIKECLSIIIKEKAYILMLVCSMLNSPAEIAANSYYSVIVTGKGGTSAQVGLGLFVMAFTEFWVVYFFSKIARRVGVERMFYLGLFGNAIRAFVLALAPNATWVVIGICTQAISFALTMPGTVLIITKIVGIKYSTTSMQIFYVARSLLQMGLSTPLGWIAENMGINTMLYLSMIPSILGAIILMFYTERRYKTGAITVGV